MATRQYTNNAAGTLSAAITNSQTGLTLSSSQGALFPSLAGGNWFVGTLDDGAGTVEVVKVTARSTDYLTIVRAQESTSNAAFPAGTAFELRPTAASFTAFSDALPASYTAGDVLYASNTTTLTTLGIGAANRPLTSTGTAPQWAASLPAATGGTGLTAYTKGDLVYASSNAPTLAKLAVGTSTQRLGVASGLPAWVNAATTGECVNLVVKQTAAAFTTSVTITADVLDIEGYRATNVNVAASLAASGAGGLDTGAEAGNTTYYVWGIRNGTTVNGLLSTSATAPTMPAGYTKKRLLSHRRNDGSSNMIAVFQVNDLALGDADAMTVGSALTATTDLDFSNFVPAAIADLILINIASSGSGGAWALDDKDNSAIRYYYSNTGPAVALLGTHAWARKNASNIVTATETSASAATTFYCAGWKVKVL